VRTSSRARSLFPRPATPSSRHIVFPWRAARSRGGHLTGRQDVGGIHHVGSRLVSPPASSSAAAAAALVSSRSCRALACSQAPGSARHGVTTRRTHIQGEHQTSEYSEPPRVRLG
jgi:hypothetical protein